MAFDERSVVHRVADTPPDMESLLPHIFFFFFFTLVTGPRRSLNLKLSDTRVYEPQIIARLGTTAHFCRTSATGREGNNLEGFNDF